MIEIISDGYCLKRLQMKRLKTILGMDFVPQLRDSSGICLKILTTPKLQRYFQSGWMKGSDSKQVSII